MFNIVVIQRKLAAKFVFTITVLPKKNLIKRDGK